MTLEIYVFLKHFVKYRLYIRNTYIENFNTFSQRAWAWAAWGTEGIVGLFFNFTYVTMKGPNKWFNRKKAWWGWGFRVVKRECLPVSCHREAPLGIPRGWSIHSWPHYGQSWHLHGIHQPGPHNRTHTLGVYCTGVRGKQGRDRKPGQGHRERGGKEQGEHGRGVRQQGPERPGRIG